MRYGTIGREEENMQHSIIREQPTLQPASMSVFSAPHSLEPDIGQKFPSSMYR